MASDTNIEWADDTVNPWWGCAKVSPACANCYAEAWDGRWYSEPDGANEGKRAAHWGAGSPRRLRVEKAIEELDKIARRSGREGRPRRVFIASMADVFEDRADLVEPRRRLWEALHRLCGSIPKPPTPRRRPGETEASYLFRCDLNDWQPPPLIIPMLLTKRPDVMAAWAKEHGWPDGAWAGTTVEDQQRADERIPHLLSVPAPVRFLSCEPLLEPVDITPWIIEPDEPCFDHGYFSPPEENEIQWVIAGGESGPKARPSHPDWFRTLRDQCAVAGVPFFFKQWGAWAPGNGGPGSDLYDRDRTKVDSGFFDYCGRWNALGCNPFRQTMDRLGKKTAGALLDGREWREVPDVA